MNCVSRRHEHNGTKLGNAGEDGELGFFLAMLKKCYKGKYENKCSLSFLPGTPLNFLLACDCSEAL